MHPHASVVHVDAVHEEAGMCRCMGHECYMLVLSHMFWVVHVALSGLFLLARRGGGGVSRG